MKLSSPFLKMPVLCLIILITAIFSASCPDPVNAGGLVISGGGADPGVDPGPGPGPGGVPKPDPYEEIPKLRSNGKTIEMDGTIVRYLGETITIEITNYDIFETIEWKWLDKTLLSEAGAGVTGVIELDTADPTAIINQKGAYLIYVLTAIDGGARHSAYFMIEIIEY